MLYKDCYWSSEHFICMYIIYIYVVYSSLFCYSVHIFFSATLFGLRYDNLILNEYTIRYDTKFFFITLIPVPVTEIVLLSCNFSYHQVFNSDQMRSFYTWKYAKTRLAAGHSPYLLGELKRRDGKYLRYFRKCRIYFRCFWYFRYISDIFDIFILQHWIGWCQLKGFCLSCIFHNEALRIITTAIPRFAQCASRGKNVLKLNNKQYWKLVMSIFAFYWGFYVKW